MSPAEKCERVVALIRLAWGLAGEGIRRRYPQASEREVFLRLVGTWLARDAITRAFRLAAVARVEAEGQGLPSTILSCGQTLAK